MAQCSSKRSKLTRLWRVDSRTSESIRQYQHGVIGTHVAVHRDPIETTRDSLLQSGLKWLGLNLRIRGKEAEHGGMQRSCGRTFAGAAHSGLDHASAFTDAPDTHALAAKAEFYGDLLGPRIASHDCFGGLRRPPRFRAEFNCGFDNPGADLIHRQRDANPPSGTNQRRPGREVEGLLREPDHLQSVRQTLLARARIRIAGIDDNGL